MNVPIWVSAWELECCQPDATVGEPWVASVVGLKPPDPWWAEHAPEPVPDEVRTLGVVDLEGTAASVTLTLDRPSSTSAESGPSSPACGGPGR